jgi:O-methyltransferase involved in polyketide biosynthesis
VEDVLGGHTWAVPPAVVWEGVTMYLPSQAIDATLGALRTLLPIGSLLATTYFGAPPRPSTRAIVRLFGEPFAFDETPPAFAARLARHHFELQSDSGDRDWNEQYLKRPLDRPRDATTRLLRFRRRPFDERLAVAIHVSK